MSTKDYFGKLDVIQEGVTVQWTIEDFLSLGETGQNYRSASFSTGRSDWFLTLSPIDLNADGEEWISLEVEKKCFDNGDCDESHPPQSFNLTLGVKRKDGTIEEIVKSRCVFFEGHYFSHAIPEFLKRSQFHKRRSELLPFGALTITFSLRVNRCFDSSSRLDVLRDSLKEMFVLQKHCDVSLNVGSRRTKFWAHKSILSARSSVFENMLENLSKDSLDVEDCEPDYFEDFLLYLYTGVVENLSSSACELYRIAKEFDMKDLQELCASFLLTHLTLENVCEVQEMANRFEERDLLNAVQQFFDRNMKAITRSCSWLTLMEENVELANELLKKFDGGK